MERTLEKICKEKIKKAIIDDDDIALRELLNLGVDPEMYISMYEYYPSKPSPPIPSIFVAIEECSVKTTTVLLEYGVNPSKLYNTQWGYMNAIHYLSKYLKPSQKMEDRIAILKLFVAYGGNLNLPRESNGHFMTLLHQLVLNDDPIMDDLIFEAIKLGADVNAKDDNGNTPLYYTFRNMNKYYLIPKLISAGADINILNNERQTIIVNMFKNIRVIKKSFHEKVETNPNKDYSDWHKYCRYDYFLKKYVDRSHKTDVKILIKMFAENGTRVDRIRSAEFLDKIIVIPDDVLGIIDSYIEEDPLDLAIKEDCMECAELLAGMRGVDLKEYKKRHRIV